MTAEQLKNSLLQEAISGRHVPQDPDDNNAKTTTKLLTEKNRKIMKKILVLMALVMTMAANAQTEHLKFKGVPIDGTLSQYTQRMKEKGFTYLGTENGMSLLEGDFAGFKNCLVVVYTLKNKDLVSFIAVKFQEYDTWSAIYNNYSTLKDMLTMKYGEPSEVIEEFQGSYIDDDNDRMHEVMMDRCKYITTFETELGTIELFITKYEYAKGCVMLKYTDKANGAAVLESALEDL